MKTWIRYSLATAFAASLLVAAGFAIAGEDLRRGATACNTLEVRLNDGEDFITADDVQELLESRYGDFIGQKLDSIRLHRMEAILDGYSAVRKSQAWITNDGTLHISIDQRVPVLRFSDGKNGYYSDAEGFIFPLHPDYTAPVPVVSGRNPAGAGDFRGRLPEGPERDWLEGTVAMVTYLKERGCEVDSLLCNRAGELSLTSQDQRIYVFGKPEGYDEKYRLMEIFQSKVLPSGKDWNIVKLTTKNQIICRKDI